MKLEYTTEPTETMTITTPIGSTYAIPIWRPVGERSKPVFSDAVPQLYERFVMDSKQRGPVMGVLALVTEHMRHCPNGCTTWDLSKALRQLRGTVNGVLVRNTDLFYSDDEPIKVDFIAPDGRRCSTMLKKWHLRKEAD